MCAEMRKKLFKLKFNVLINAIMKFGLNIRMWYYQTTTVWIECAGY